MEILAIAGGLGTAGALVAVVVLAFKLAAAKDAVIARGAQLATLTVESGQIQARLVNERDTAIERAARLAAEVADLSARLTTAEQERNELADKLSRAVMARVAAAPLAEGAEIVNDIFARPFPSGGKK